MVIKPFVLSAVLTSTHSAPFEGGSRWRPLPSDPLSEDHVHVIAVALEARESDWEILSVDEAARARRFVVRDKQDQFVSARAALRRVLGTQLGRRPEEVVLALGRHGKPALPDGALEFNLSHSERGALLALLLKPAPGDRLGVDLEYCARGRRFEALIRRFFHPLERAALAHIAGAGEEADFYRVWVRKEAYVKAIGTGLTFSSRRFQVTVDSSAPRLVASEWQGDGNDSCEGQVGRQWSLADVELPESFSRLGPVDDEAASFRACVCWRGEPSSILRWTLDSVQG